MPGEVFDVVPMISELMNGIQQTRAAMKGYYFDELVFKQGITRIEGNKKVFSSKDNRYVNRPNKANGCSEAADALRQHAQAKEAGLLDRSDKTTTYEEQDADDWRVI